MKLTFAVFYSDNVTDITHALQRLTEASHVASLSTAVSRATSRISAMSERSSQEFPIPGKLLHEILKVSIVQVQPYHANFNWPRGIAKWGPGVLLTPSPFVSLRSIHVNMARLD